jgi:hypothetical protein
MSILSYKPSFSLSQSIAPQGISLQGFQPNITPPTPPTPVVPINTVINDCCGVIYNKVKNKIVNSTTANLLNGIYVSNNKNAIPQNLTSVNLLNIKRYCSGTTKNLAINDTKLSLTTDLNIYFWVYVIYSNSMVKPITILTRGSSSSYGEYTVQILPNKTLAFYYTYNGNMTVVRSNLSIPERSLIFVSILKKLNSVGIYFNNNVDNFQNISGISSGTTNPLLIGDGYNSSPFTGFIDNLMISTFPIDGIAYMSRYFSYTPTSMIYQFSNGSLTYNGYNIYSNIPGVQPNSLDSAKYICTQLDNYSTGFSLSSANNYLFYLTNISGVDNIGGSIYEKINTLNMANNYFSKLVMELPRSINVSFTDYVLIDGHIKCYNGEVYFFSDGVIYEYDIITGNYVVSSLDSNRANYILSIITQIIGYKYSFDKFQFYSYFKDVKENVDGLNNYLVKKILHYTIGGVNTIVDFNGQSNAGTWRFNSDIQYLNIDNNSTRSLEKNEGSSDNTEIFINKGIAYIDNINTEVVNLDPFIKTRELRTTCSDNNIFVYTGQNIIGLLNNPTDLFVNNLPVLENTLPFYFVLDKETDIIETLISMNIPLNRQIIISCKTAVSNGMFNLSMISNSQTRLFLDSKEYKINSNYPQHIVFHCSKNTIDIEIQFYYNKLNQVCKFILIQP